ncbi:MAG: alpha/beta hydrolase [Pusillimonas sp.]
MSLIERNHSRSGTLPQALAAWLETVNTIAAQAAVNRVQPTPDTARQALAGLTRMYGGQGPELARVCDFRLAGCPDIPLRLYDPCTKEGPETEAAHGPGAHGPLLVYLHGGGHMAGSIDVYDPIMRRVAWHTGCRTLAVEYRLAPEHPYPHGLNDCLAVLRALSGGAEGSQLDSRQGIRPLDTHHGIILAGDSGGGALAATLTAQSVTDSTLTITGQILVYPSLDYTLEYPSTQSMGRGYLLETDRIRWYFDNYFQHGECRKAASPLNMPATGLPPTLLFTGGFCPLRDEGYAYADHLLKNAVACQHENFPDMVHAWLNIHTLVPEACESTYAVMGQWIQTALSPPRV